MQNPTFIAQPFGTNKFKILNETNPKSTHLTLDASQDQADDLIKRLNHG